MAAPRVLLLDAEPAAHRFSAVARQLADSGFDVTLATDIQAPKFPLICGRGRATETAALRHAYAAAEQFGDTFNAVIAPCRGGVAHGLLMRRATEPALRAPAIALWCDAPTRWLALHEDIAPTDTGMLVADALERATLRMADLLIGPHAAAFERVRSLGEPLPPVRQAWLPELEAAGPLHAGAPALIEELVFVGPLSRANGALVFMDAIERLAAQGLPDRVHVTFLGSAEAPARGVGLQILGVRSSQWPFQFRVETETDPAKLLAYLAQPGRLAVFAAMDAEDDRLLRAAMRAGCAVLAGDGYDVTRASGEARNVCRTGASAWTEALQQALAGAAGTSAPPPAATDWPQLIRDLLATARRQPPIQRPPARSASIGVLHHGRPDLHRALNSIPGGSGSAVVVVIDNGSATPPQGLDAIVTRVLRIEPGLTQPAAYNRFAAETASDVLIFLDDDNTFAPHGIRRLHDALASGWFDIVVSTLDLVDGNPAVDPSSGRFIFLGDAGMAGLFFNGFGDTAMAVRREAFLRVGGFGDRGHLFSGLDWEFLARARAAGLAIGVLHEPAIRYARRTGNELREWRKGDVQGMRRAAAAAYGSAIDGPLLARLAQGLQLADD